MTSNEYTIDITSNVDASSIEELSNKLEEINNQAQQVNNVLNLDTNGLDEVTNSSDNISSSIEETTSQITNLDTALDTISTSSLDAVSSSADNVSASFDTTSSTIQGLSSDMDNTNNSVIPVSANLDKTTNSSSLLSTGISGLISIGLGAFLNDAAQSADTVAQEFSRVSLNLKQTQEEMKKTKEIISQVREETSRTGSEVRNHFSSMGLAGVTNTQKIAESFKMVSGTAFKTGNSVSNVSEMMKKMIMTNKIGSRQLQTMGLSTETVSQAMKKLGYNVGDSSKDVSKAFENMSDDVQADVLTTSMAIGGAEEASQKFNSTLEATQNNASAASGAIVRQLGEGVGMVLIPVLKTAKIFLDKIGDAFKSLPQPVQNFIKGIAGIALVVITVITIISTLIKVFQVLNIIQTLSIIKTIILTAANWALAIAEWAVASPILLIIIIILILIAALVYLYYNNEQVRNSINAIGAAIVEFGNYVKGAFINTLNFFKTLPTKIWNILLNIIAKIKQWGANTINSGKATITGFINTIVSAARGLPGKIYSAIVGIIGKVKNVFSQAWKTASNYIRKITAPITGLFHAGWYGESERGITPTNDWSNEYYRPKNKNAEPGSVKNVTINLNGIIEEKASKYIVKTITNELRRENLINGN